MSDIGFTNGHTAASEKLASQNLLLQSENARLRNERDIAVASAKIMPDLYASEINVTISWFWDGGFNVQLGDSMNGIDAYAWCDTWPEAVAWLRDKAIELYPDSDFAKANAPAATKETTHA